MLFDPFLAFPVYPIFPFIIWHWKIFIFRTGQALIEYLWENYVYNTGPSTTKHMCKHIHIQWSGDMMSRGGKRETLVKCLLYAEYLADNGEICITSIPYSVMFLT